MEKLHEIVVIISVREHHVEGLKNDEDLVIKWVLEVSQSASNSSDEVEVLNSAGLSRDSYVICGGIGN